MRNVGCAVECIALELKRRGVWATNVKLRDISVQRGVWATNVYLRDISVQMGFKNFFSCI